MPKVEPELVNRLLNARQPDAFWEWESHNGYYLSTCHVCAEDVPALLDIVRKWSDPGWPRNADELDSTEEPRKDWECLELVPVTAWRALGDLKAAAAVDSLVEFLENLDDEFDEWVSEELPDVFGKIGEVAVEPLIRLAANKSCPEANRSVAVRSLKKLVDYCPATRERILSFLARMMSDAPNDDMQFNTTVMSVLVENGAVEAAESIERAFAADALDAGYMGDWEDVRKTLGVEGLGLEMPVRPYNSFERFREQFGIGTFSSQPLFIDAEVQQPAVEQYYATAFNTFSLSPEGLEAKTRFGGLEWHLALLRFGVTYLGEPIDQITAEGVDEFVLEYIPRKVLVESSAAGSIIGELTFFWQFVDRVYRLPNARSIIDWLATENLTARLEAELSNANNYGQAKSLALMGMRAGYDMSSEADANRFFAAYNRALTGDSSPVKLPGKEKKRVGRNDPCPCGSGKKFKKCCAGTMRPQ